LATSKQEHLDNVKRVQDELLAALVGMDYCLDWKQDSSEWSARELVYHVLDTPAGGVHSIVKGILSGEITEYEIWSDLTNLTPERLAYDLAEVTGDIETFCGELSTALAGMSDDDLEGKVVKMHQKTRGVDEERTLNMILERTLNVHIREHLVQLQTLREALAI